MKLLRRTVRVIAMLGVVVASAVACYAVPLNARIAAYDAAFGKLQHGQHSEHVVAMMGLPNNVSPPRRRGLGIETFYVYRVNRGPSPPVRWTIGLDGAGRVVSKHRDSNGC